MITESAQRLLDDLARRAGVRGVPRGAVAAIAVVLAATLVLAAWRWWPRDATARAVPPAMESSERAQGAISAPPVATATPETQASVTVHVVGAVRHPGVYSLPGPCRVADCVEAAGGSLPDAALEALNMARTVADGEQILVPDRDQVDSGAVPQPQTGSPPSAGGTAISRPQAVNVNTADAALLDTLPGVGPSTAEKIVSDREANGPFASVEDLGRVSGIGPKKLEQLKDLVCVR